MRRFIHPAAREGDQTACAHTTRAPAILHMEGMEAYMEGMGYPKHTGIYRLRRQSCTSASVLLCPPPRPTLDVHIYHGLG